MKHPHLEPFTEWEAAVIVQAQKEMGNNWLGELLLHLSPRPIPTAQQFQYSSALWLNEIAWAHGGRQTVTHRSAGQTTASACSRCQTELSLSCAVAAIAKLLLPGRSNTAVKNFWHCRLKSGSGTNVNR